MEPLIEKLGIKGQEMKCLEDLGCMCRSDWDRRHSDKHFDYDDIVYSDNDVRHTDGTSNGGGHYDWGRH